MRRKDREVIDDGQIDEIIMKSKICRIGFYDNGEIYIVPLNFGFVHSGDKRIFYFHGAKEGRKFELIRNEPKVGFELDTAYKLIESETACGFSAMYQSVIGTGIISEICDFNSKKLALAELMNTITGRKEWNFPAHAIDAVAVFKMVVETISCKQHLAR